MPEVPARRARVRLAVAACALLAAAGCASASDPAAAPGPTSGSGAAVAEPTPTIGLPPPPAPAAPAPVHPIPNVVDSASGFARLLGHPGELGDFTGVAWTCGSAVQRLSDGQTGYHCVSAGDVDGQPGTFVFDVGADHADRVSSFYLAAVGQVPAGNGGVVTGDQYLDVMLGLIGNSDPGMDQQLAAAPRDTPPGTGRLSCTETDTRLQGVRIGPVLLQWGACSGDWAPWYTVRVTAR